MTKYIIKATYTEGEHAGTSHLIDKSGYVRDNASCIFEEDAYTLSACKAACTRKYKSNTAEVEAELRERAWKTAHGKTVSKYPLYIMTDYEPYAVEVY